ncbi:STAS domain-containing protein [Petroclostridium sp. X23]|uniref:STAS domain-containing protein n=1 Tax=Petroclostridium sp. X23 TaxID=3045146 RepID=UPI0024AD01E8|nr:STAS domain-containing protein [Petroclostridium sp. X23]WHH60084.1 STAS domain-containing protein [Petroclostridium sp. X23]
MDRKFEISVKNGSLTEIMLDGEFDIMSAKNLKIILERVTRAANTDVVINCEQLTYIDSVGINLLVKNQVIMNNKGLHIYLINANRNIRKLFSIINLLDTFEMAS